MLKQNLLLVLSIIHLLLPCSEGYFQCDRRWGIANILMDIDYYVRFDTNFCICTDMDVDTDLEQYYDSRRDCRVFMLSDFEYLFSNEVKTNSFMEFINLEQIYLNHSNLETIEPGGFNGLTNLRNLYLQNNYLKNITEGLFNSLTNLRVLFLDENRINLISDYAFMGLNQLMVLSLKDNDLSYLQKGIFKPLWNLKLLNISNNPLQIVSQLELSLVRFSAQSLSFNELFRRCKNLVMTDVNNVNRTITLDMAKLDFLDLSNNSLVSLPALVFNDAINLTFLNLSFNLLHDINSDVFVNVYNLTTLDLHHNLIDTLPNGIFNDLTSLNYLDLSQNQIKTLHYGYFEDLLKLQILNLSSNMISDFNYLRSSEHLSIEIYLDNNQLTDLDFEIFNRVSKISLDKNLWDCKKLSKLVAYVEKVGISLVYGTTHRVENIHKIACNQQASFVNVSFDDTNSVQVNLDSVFSKIDSVIKSSDFFKFFKNDFKNTLFYKYFDNFNSTFLDSHVIHNITLNIAHNETTTNTSDLIKTLSSGLSADCSRADFGKDVHMILYFLTFALYIIICILLVFLWILVRKNRILGYQIPDMNLKL